MNKTPQEIYQSNIQILQIRVDALNRWYEHLSSMRMTCFFAALALGSFNQYHEWFSQWWISLFALIFLILVVVHEYVVTKRERVLLQIDFFSRGIDRINGTWHKNQIHHQLDPIDDHLYAHDLEIFGKNSLFNLLCIAYSQSGKRQLQKWLSSTPSKELIEARQAASIELTQEVDFRLALNVQAAGLKSPPQSKQLEAWATTPAVFTKAQIIKYQVIAWTLSISMVIALILWGHSDKAPFLFFSVLILEIIFYRFMNKKLAPLFAQMETPNKELGLISFLLMTLEEKTFSSKFLKNLQSKLDNKNGVVSKEILKFNKMIDRLDMRRNQFFAIPSYLFMWSVHFGLIIEKWRTKHSKNIPIWFETIGEFEAASSVATYAFEHPQDIYPVIKNEAAFFHGEDLGHPLISDAECIRNSIKLDQSCNLWMISGSNMCGKSTFLRVVGINLVLSYIGAPIRGKSLSLSPLTLASSINIKDSLHKGHSKFYTEILQVKLILEAAKSKPPVLFLLDELLHGTNSHDRLTGAKAIIAHLLKNGGVGLITTHDLILTKAIEELNLSAKNMHFRDQFDKGELAFDYKVHTGVVPKSNALELMRSIGIDV